MFDSRVVRIVAPLLLAAGLVLFLVLNYPGGRDDPGRPGISSQERGPGDLPLSLVTVTLAYDAADMLDELERAVPLQMGGLHLRQAHPTLQGLQYAFVARRDPFTVEMSGDSLRIATVIRYGGQAWYAAPFGLQLTTSCGISTGAEGDLRTAVAFASPIQIEDDWSLRSAVELTRIEPVSPADRCVISLAGAELDVTDELLAAAEAWFRDQASRIDEVFAATRTTDQLEAYWEMLGNPIPLGGDAWLALGAEGVRFADLRGNGSEGGRFQAVVEIAARPRITVGTPPEAEVRALPPHGRAWVDEGAGILVEGRVDYASISELAAAELRETEWAAFGRSVRIRQVRISGVGDGRMSVVVEVEGALEGSIELVGTPVFDPVSNEIHIPDLAVTVPSGTLLLRSAGWVLRTWFPSRIRALARWPMSGVLAEGRAAANQGLNVRFSDEVRMEGTMGAMEVVSIQASDDGLVVRGRVEATTHILIAQE